MKALVVVTNPLPAELIQRVAAGTHPRTEYMALAEAVGARYAGDRRTILSRLEETLRLNLRQAWTVRRLVRREGYEVVLSLSERVGLPLAYLLPRRIRHVVVVHHPLSPAKLQLLRRLRLERRFPTMLVLSEAEARGLREQLPVDADAIHVLRFPTDTDFYQPQEVPLSQQDHIESVGLSHRDYPTLLRAMRRLPRISCHVHAGSPWLARAGGFDGETPPDNVHLQPCAEPDALRACYARCRFVVVPMRQTTYWSAGSTVLQEAQAMGKAVIATRLPGLAEYMVDGETGLLVPAGDEEALAAAIDELWHHPDRAAAMGRRGRAWIAANFSLSGWVRRASRYLDTAPPGGG
jgi:glycosyltransferase involved in cell wall biosynthesis